VIDDRTRILELIGPQTCERCKTAMYASLESARIYVCLSGQHFKMFTLRDIERLERAAKRKKQKK
jgi:hypothetical protein